MKGSVKIMLSYDYNHFEVSLASDEDMTVKQINELRKQAQRLVDEAVRQYKKARKKANKALYRSCERTRLEEEVKLLLKKPELTAEEKAKIKALEDYEYWNEFQYDYEDDEI